MTPVEKSMRRSIGYNDVVRANPKPKKKRDGIASAVKYSDKQFSRYIILRDKRCVTCGSNYLLQCSHVFRRHSYTTRWDSQNAYAQCKSCHFKHHNHSEYPLQQYAATRIGHDAMDDLWLRSKQVSHFTASYIRGLGDMLAKMIGEMEEGGKG